METGKAKQIALERFKEKFNCAEATLMGLAEAEGLRCNCIPRIATAFGGGISGQGEVCGALTGAAMALGLRCGRDRADDLEAKSVTYRKVREMHEAFQEKFGSIRCIDLVGFSLMTPEGIARANELDLHNNLCPDFVGFVAEVAERLMKNG